MAKKVKVYLDYPKDGEEKEQIVGLNGKLYRIKKGEEVEVPEGVAEILKTAKIAQRELYKFLEEEAAKSSSPKT